MAIQDTDAERRNLVVISIAFIAYYIGEGKIESEVLKLPLINIHFHNIQALIVMLWVALGWFLFRYWLTHRKLFSEGLREEMNDLTSHPLVVAYFKKDTGLPLPPRLLNEAGKDEEGYKLTSLRHDSSLNRLVLRYYLGDVRREKITGRIISPSGSMKSFKSIRTGETVTEERVLFTGLRGILTITVCILHCFVTQPSFSSYVVPYLLVFTALVLGWHDLAHLISSLLTTESNTFIC